jgi:NTE family protein
MELGPVPNSARTERSRMALCLSGGGYRAALFHLGVCQRLHELGLLDRIDTFSSVSGGSILNAHLATQIGKWRSQPVASWERDIAVPFRKFCNGDIRTWPLLKRGLPWNWLDRSTQASALADQYFAKLTKLHLVDLPTEPRFVFCSTDLVNGVNWVFERDRVGGHASNYRKPRPDWRLATAIAASSCFPPLFGPMAVKRWLSAPNGDEGAWARVRLTDGGVYDNLGLEPVWKTHATVLVSDGGAPFREEDPPLINELMRYVDVSNNQVHALRLRSFFAGIARGDYTGAYWGIGAHSQTWKTGTGYGEPLVETIISRVRTDMNDFSGAEMAVLENHGYFVADAAVRSKLGIPVPAIPLAPPHPMWTNEELVRFALAHSHKRMSPLRTLRNISMYLRPPRAEDTAATV